MIMRKFSTRCWAAGQRSAVQLRIIVMTEARKAVIGPNNHCLEVLKVRAHCLPRNFKWPVDVWQLVRWLGLQELAGTVSSLCWSCVMGTYLKTLQTLVLRIFCQRAWKSSHPSHVQHSPSSVSILPSPRAGPLPGGVRHPPCRTWRNTCLSLCGHFQLWRPGIRVLCWCGQRLPGFSHLSSYWGQWRSSDWNCQVEFLLRQCHRVWPGDTDLQSSWGCFSLWRITQFIWSSGVWQDRLRLLTL